MAFDMPESGGWEVRAGWVVRNLSKDIGLTLPVAAGLVGQFGFESEEFETYHEKGVPADKGGVGWAQWTGPRRREFEAYCAGRGLDPRTAEASYGFLLAELKGSYASFTSKLRACVTVEDACRLAHRLYETPSDVLDGTYRSGPARLAYAQRALTGAKCAGASAATRLPCCDRDLVADVVRALQRIVGADPDGALGPETIQAVTTAQRAS